MAPASTGKQSPPRRTRGQHASGQALRQDATGWPVGGATCAARTISARSL